MTRLIEWSKRGGRLGEFARSVLVLAGGTAASQVVVFLASPLITRLYSPADMGVVGVYTSLLSILTGIVALRYELAIPMQADDQTATDLVVLCFLSILGVSGMVSVGLFLGGEWLLDLTGASAIKSYIWLLPVSLFGIGAYQTLNYWAVRSKSYGTIARTKLVQSVWQLSTQISLGLAHIAPFGLLLGYVVGQIAGSGTLAGLLKGRAWRYLHHVSWDRVRRIAYRYKRFPLLSGISALLNIAGLQLPALLLAAYYGSEVTGWYGLSMRVIGVPMALLGQAVSQVYLGQAGQLIHTNPAALKELLDRTARRLFLWGSLPIALLGVLGPWLFSFVFGEDWYQAGVFLRWLTPMFVVQFVVSPISQIAFVAEAQGLQLLGDLARLVLVIAAFVVPHTLGTGPVLTIGVYSGVMTLTYIGFFFLYRMIARKIGSGQRGLVNERTVGTK